MIAMDIEVAERTAEEWRTAEGPGNPAGPLYASGIFAEPDIMEAEASYTFGCSACTASQHVFCC